MPDLIAPVRRVPRPGRRMRLWLCAVTIGVLMGILHLNEDAFSAMRARIRQHAASGTIGIVDIDEKSLDTIGKWPIPRHDYADAMDRVFAMGARRVYVAIDLASAQNDSDDARLVETLRRYQGRVFLSNRIAVDAQTGKLQLVQPFAAAHRVAPALNIAFQFDESGSVRTLPYSVEVDGVKTESFAQKIAGRDQETAQDFKLDGAIELNTIPRVSLVDVLQGTVDPKRIAGKDLVIGSSSEQVQNYYPVPPYGRNATVLLQVIGAETLLAGTPHDIGWLPGVAIAAALIFGLMTIRRRSFRLAGMLVAAALFPLLPALLPNTVSVAVLPAIAMLVMVGVVQLVQLMRELIRKRERTNQVSGLLNLTALRQLPDQPDRSLIVAHIHNFAEVIAALPSDAEAILIGQIASRLKLGMTEAELYHGDNGVFAWFAGEDETVLGERLEGLHALFRSPVTVTGANVDLSVTFGVDDDGSRSVANRLGSALVAAAEAAAEGGKWRAFDKAKLADAAWKLSLLSQLDAAIDDGHLWVAYQPKLDLVTRRLVGAEALVRWTHPEKGAISPLEFVPAAEQHNRIEKLTAHVLERAVLAAATINAHDIPFGIAVNLSARLLETRDIVETVANALAANRLDPDHLTLEITETATIAAGKSLEVLKELRGLGIRISIDDYGTGLSTLEYLRKVPASEIKIDRSFVQSMTTSGSDLLMVNSTIQLAHSLGHIVVAEGVETDDVLARLAEMQCDIAQGYRIGRPMTFQDLARRLLAERKHAA